MYYHSFYTVDPFRPKSVQFDVWSSQEIRKLSMAKIQSVILFDALGYPVPGGLYDTRLGPLSFNSDPCATCGHNLKKCVGHYGHIDLPLTVFNPLFMTVVTNILKACCRKCCKFMISEAEKSIYIAQFKLVDAGYLNEAHALDSYLEEHMYKMPSEIREEMEKFCRDTIVNPSPNLCKYADDRWRYYESRLLRQGAVVKVCFHCKTKVTKVKKSGYRLYEEGKVNVYLTPMSVRDHFREVWKNEMPLLKTLFKVMTHSDELHPTDLCFIDCVLVTPSNTRPVNIVNKKLVEHPKTVMYKGILFDCQNLLSIMQVMNDKENAGKEITDIVEACQGGTINEKLDKAWNSLQVHVNALLDANALKALVNTSVGVAKIGLKQLIEKKAGILRKNMMGKRVDYFARSVVTPDPMLNINEVGVPIEFAKKLTYPVPVTPWNVNELRKAVLNGPQKHPGANIVEDDGSVLWISGTSKENRKSLAKTLFTPKLDASGPKVVHRHLLDGDILLMNRQPSLHKPSIMAHKARILKGEKTFRLHYGNCKAYNADFDGDEINLHGVQSESSRAEALEIVNAAYQYLVPRDGTPLSGLIQDHVIAGFRLTSRDKFFDRLQYNKLVFNAIGSLVDDIKTLPPCIRKPKTLWSGKQVISTVIINLTPAGEVPLNLDSKTKLGFNAWLTTAGECDYMTKEERHYMSETNVVIRQGEFLSGLLDKNHVGSSHYSVVHYFYELYGGDYSANLLSAFSKLFTFYLQTDGFTLGVLDILVKKRPDSKRKKIAKKTRGVGVDVAKRALTLPADEEVDEEQLQRLMEIAYKKNTNFRGFIDSEYKATLDQVTNDINRLCLPVGLLQPFPANNLQLMVQSGAKGSTVNTMQISCLLGQIELEGKRPPLMISGKSLPSFRPYDPSPMAGGFISSRFMTGIRPQEFFFHCMAGREGLIDTAVKTSRSGYLQRCLVKHLEGLVVHYDQTVRDTDHSVVQFYYGEDGLDILKSQLLKPSQMKFFSENTDAFVNKREMRRLKRETVGDGLKERKSLVAAHSTTKPQRDGKFLQFCREMAREQLPNVPTPELPGRAKQAGKLCRMWQTMVDDDNKKRYGEKISRCPDPVIADFKSDIHFGAVSEVIENMIDDYIAKNEGILPIKKSKFKDIIYSKTLKSLCQPGEAVGVLAAQSVGEPSTQMTLNTFHFAGRGEMNVTLGIPRLREILMVASKRIKTPTMEIPFKTDVPELETKAEFLRKSFTRVVLKDVLEKVTVKESLRIRGERVRVYDLEFSYLPRRGYSNSTNLKPRHILSYVDEKFSAKLFAMLKKFVKSFDGEELISGKKATKKDTGETGNGDDEKDNMRHLDEDSDDDSDADGDGDASDMKRRDRRTDALEYDDDDDDDEEDVSPNSTLGAAKVPKSEKDSDEDDGEMAVDDDGIPQDENSESSDDEASNLDTTLNLDKIIDSVVGLSLQKKGVQVIDDYSVEKITHDPVKKMWSKIKLIVSLKYKRIDLSDILPALLENCVVYEVPGIKRAITYRNGDGLLTLKAEGSNGIAEFFKHDRLLDLNKLYSNDIHAVARTYGIEAANRVILKEVQEVFKVYGITVDPRHLLLIADYMTFDGSFQPLNRAGMDNCPSPLQQMTFESTLKYLKNATIHKLQDNLQSPSSCLIVGQESKIGSGLVRLFNK